jgi:AcrR family transcriptional regulator
MIQELNNSMARTRTEIDSQKKREEIINAARFLILSEGYEATGMTRIAQQAGVAPNTLYWYFKDKDELLLVILDELVNEALHEYFNVQGQSLEQQILWLLTKFDAVPNIITTVHARMNISQTIQEWHQRFHFMLESLMVNQLILKGLDQVEANAAAKITMFVIEGLLSHHAGDPAERGSIVKFLVSRLG